MRAPRERHTSRPTSRRRRRSLGLLVNGASLHCIKMWREFQQIQVFLADYRHATETVIAHTEYGFITFRRLSTPLHAPARRHGTGPPGPKLMATMARQLNVNNRRRRQTPRTDCCGGAQAFTPHESTGVTPVPVHVRGLSPVTGSRGRCLKVEVNIILFTRRAFLGGEQSNRAGGESFAARRLRLLPGSGRFCGQVGALRPPGAAVSRCGRTSADGVSTAARRTLPMAGFPRRRGPFQRHSGVQKAACPLRGDAGGTRVLRAPGLDPAANCA
jgi:hypothetical protein